MANTTTNRITLRIGVVFDKAALDAQAKKISNDMDSKYAKNIEKQTAAMNKQTGAISNTSKEIKKQKTITEELTGTWNKTIAGFLKFTVISSIFMSVTVAMKQMKDLIFELDTAMTNLSIVTNATESELAMVDARASQLTTTLGALKGEVINSITEFARAGYDLADAMTLAEKSTMAANVGFTELDKITTFVIAGLKSFKLEAEESTRLLDVLFRVANVTAIDLEGIGEAFLRSANTLKVAGATLEESAALISAANESIQDPAKVGTALKTIASRLRGISEEGEVVPTLAEDFRRVGVEIQNADGSFRNIYDVFQDFAMVYQTLDDLTKESLLEKLAGKRQKNIMIGLLENFDIAQMALEEAIDSAGAVAQANEKYLDSLEGKTKILTETWGEFLRQLGDSAAYKAGIDALTAILKLATMMTNGFGGLITSAGLLAVGLSALSPLLAGTVTLATGGLSLLVPILTTVVGAFLGYSSIVELTSSKTDTLTESTKKLTEAQKENANVVQNGTIKQQKELANQLQEVIDKIDEANKAYQDSMTGTSGSDTISGSIREITDATNNYNKSVEMLEAELQQLGFTQQEARDFISQTRVATEGLSQALIDMAEAVFSVKQIVSSSSKEYQILSDALYDLETQGYLSDDMLNTLIETYPDLITVTGLQIDKVREYARAERESTDEVIAKSKEMLNAKIVEAEQVLKLNQAKLESVMALTKQENQYYSVVEAVKDYSKSISESNKIIQDAKNSLALLNNETAQISDIDVHRGESLKDFYEKDIKKVEKPLTDLERKLRDINQAISVQQKLYARTDDAEEQIRINDKLIGLYKEQRVAIQNVRAEFEAKGKNIKQNTAEYDDYIDQLYKFDLQIEDATNSVFSLTQQTAQLTSELRKSLVTELSDTIRASQKVIERAKQKELQGIEDTIDALDEEYKLRKEKFDLEKEEAEYRKRMAELEGEISQNVIEAQLLSTDNSLESQRRRAELAEELVELNKKKTDEITEYDYKQAERAIEDEYKLKRAGLEKQANDIKRFLTNLGDDTEVLLERISATSESNIEGLQALINGLTEGISEDTLSALGSTWDTILGKIQAYADALAKLTNAPIINVPTPPTASSSISPTGQVESKSSTGKPINLDSIYTNPAFSPTTSATRTVTPTTNNTSSSQKIDSVIRVDQMNNIIQSDYDVKRVGSNLAKGSTNVLSGYGYTFTEK